MPAERRELTAALAAFANQPLRTAATALWKQLGYSSDRDVGIKSRDHFRQLFDPHHKLREDHARFAEWSEVAFLFQLTDADLRHAGGERGLPFDSTKRVEDKEIRAYYFLAIHLDGPRYTRTDLARITRAVNRLFLAPTLILFRHGDALSIGVIDRRIGKLDETRDIVADTTRVSLIKDVRFADPHRAHIEILLDLAFPALRLAYGVTDFVSLHEAWRKRLASLELNERFYRDLANWYFWALQRGESGRDLIYPRSVGVDEEQRSLFLIRLLTRLIFCWFLVEKGLLPRELFRPASLRGLLRDFSPTAGTYYRAVLQNLFFATLSQERGERSFRGKNPAGLDPNRGAHGFFRHADLFRDPAVFEAQVKDVPFLNGGLFECLDTVFTKDEAQPNIRLDDFSEEKGNTLRLPNDLFFAEEVEADLSEATGQAKDERAKVRGLIELLDRYKFTVEENTPLEQEVALDPELLGQVFENLLASYNPDTRTTARKATGSFYTPRVVVSYMVDEALIAYLAQALPTAGEPRLRVLFDDPPDAYPVEKKHAFTDTEKDALVHAIDRVKILDPACGSGAFPMGALHRLVDLLTKLDPGNDGFRERQLAKARHLLTLAGQRPASPERESDLATARTRLAELERAFDKTRHRDDYARKLCLIENCIYGVDKQPIACQIAKLRFFIALIVDQERDLAEKNVGILPLPNLETKVAAADTLLPIEGSHEHQFDLLDQQVRPLREQLASVRHEHFNARDARRKKSCRKRDAELRAEIARVLRGQLGAATAQLLAAWNPYDQNTPAAFFDPEWMFGRLRDPEPPSSAPLATLSAQLSGGFDIAVANPPYVRQEQIKEQKPLLKPHYPEVFTGTADLYVYFYARSLQLLRPGGQLAFITSNKFFRAGYGENLRFYLATHTRLRQVIDFGDAPVFTAIAYPCIVLAEKGKPESGHTFSALNWEPGQPIPDFVSIVRQKSFDYQQTNLKATGWRVEGDAMRGLMDKLKARWPSLSKHCKGRVYYGIKTGYNEAFVLERDQRDELIRQDKKSEEILKPLIRGRDVKRWRLESHDLWLIFTRRGININAYEAVRDYLAPMKSRLMPGAPGGRKPGSYEWYEIQDNIAYWKEFSAPKVIVPAITDTVNYAPDTEHFYSNDKTSIFVPPSVPFALAVTNSPVSLWIARQDYPTKQGGFFEFKPTYFSELPIPTASPEQQAAIETVVDYLLWLHRADAGTVSADALMTGYWEQVVNALVYELYFPDELRAHLAPTGRDPAHRPILARVQAANLPAVTTWPAARRTSELRALFQQLYDTDHPLRGTLYSLASLETVKLIEGRA
jgi:adenine-specific DNA-methyltransferase